MVSKITIFFSNLAKLIIDIILLHIWVHIWVHKYTVLLFKKGRGAKNPAPFPPDADALSAYPAFDFKSEKE